MISSNDVFIDFETRSRQKLVGPDSVGAWRYSIDESTTPLCMSYAFGSEHPCIWVLGTPQPPRLREAILDGVRVHGWNSMSFEFAIMLNQMAPKYNWAIPKLRQWYDTMSDALALALPAKLETCAEVLGTAPKDKEGKRLIEFFCKPIATGQFQGQFRDPNDNKTEFFNLCRYCNQDVIAERDIYCKLPYHVEGIEREVQLVTVLINQRGLPIDVGAVEAIAEAIEHEVDYLSDLFHHITGIVSPTQKQQFKDWLADRGYPLANMQEDTINEALEKWVLPSNIKNALSLYVACSKTSNAKYKKILKMLCPDGTVKDNLIYSKANTRRYAGANFQGQNLVSHQSPAPEILINMFQDRDIELLRTIDYVTTLSSGLIRSMIKATPGKKLISGDLSKVEAIGTCWTAGEWDLVDNFKKGIDSYRVAAGGMYGIPQDEVTKDQRQAGKVTVLSGGFGGWAPALMRMAKKYKVEIDNEKAVSWMKAFRKSRPRLVGMWDRFNVAAMRAINNPGYMIPVDTTKRFKFRMEGEYLFMYLPSGGRLSFPFAKIERRKHFNTTKDMVTAMWIDGKTKQWVRRALTGANLFQSAVQGSCRDFLTESHLRVEAEDYPLILSVHDEGLSMTPDTPFFNAKEYDRMMTTLPDWAAGFPLKSDCWEGYRYKK